MIEKYAQVNAVAVHMAGLDIVLTCILESMAKTQPAVARQVVRDIRARAAHPLVSQHPLGAEVQQKAVQYSLLIESFLAQQPQ